MRRLTILIPLFLILFVFGASLALAQTPSGDIQHTVQPGENLFRIAQQYGVTVQAIAAANNLSDPNNLRVGQVLIIPRAAITPTATAAAPQASLTPAPTPLPTTTARTHLVKDGENLYTIAARYGVTVVSLAELNGITNYNLVRIGQVLQIPPVTSPLAPPRPDAVVAATPVTPVANNQAVSFGFDFGIQVSLTPANSAAVIGQVEELGMSWVGLKVDWSLYETTRGQINFSGLDPLIAALDGAELNILLTVTNAPAWARPTTQEQGPPILNEDYAAFIRELADRYQGVVDAYEIWSEPNLRRAWNGKPLSAQGYVDLLKLAFNAVKLADPAAVVVTAGLAPTATNDGTTAIDDRVFLRGMYQAGAAQFSDAIGVHAAGWANAPDSVCCRTKRPAVVAWDDQKAFFFLETLRDYRQIMTQNNDSGTFLWVTDFGWGSSAGIEGSVNPDYAYVTYTDAQEQAQYIVRAFQIGRDLTYVGPMFLNNLNFCAAGGDALACYWGLLTADGQPRAAYEELKALPKE